MNSTATPPTPDALPTIRRKLGSLCRAIAPADVAGDHARATMQHTAATRPRKNTSGMQHPKARPTARCRPDRVSGTPIRRDSRPLAPEMPTARFQENENPYLRPMPAILPGIGQDSKGFDPACLSPATPELDTALRHG